MMMGLFINKDSLDNNMNLIRETLKQKIEVIQNLQNQLKEYSNLDSTSQAIEVLKTYAKEDIYNNFNQMVEVFNSIINKTYLIQDRYEQLCGNCSLDEDELEENINKLNKVIKIVEDVKYNLDYIDLFDTLPLNQYIIDLNDLKQMYQNKLDGLLEFNQYTNNIFNEEIDKLAIIANNLDRLTDKLENPIEGIDLELTKTNSMFMKINNEEINDVTLEEEKLVGISKDDFSKMYKEQYGFDDEEIELIWKVMVRIYQKYPNVEEAEYQFCLLMGRIGYNKSDSELQSSVWDNTTGSLGYEDPRDYMMNELGLTKEEANKLYYRVRLQHSASIINLNSQLPLGTNEVNALSKFLNSEINPDTGKIYTDEEIDNILADIDKNMNNSKYYNLWESCLATINDMKVSTLSKNDFTHQMITTATIQYKEDKLKGKIDLGINVSIPDYTKDGTWDDEAGWYGDIYGINIFNNQVIPPSMSNSDYKSDLDSVNILHMQQELSKNTYCSYEQSSKIYYEKLQSGEINRASYFVNNNPDVLEQLEEEAYKKYYRENIGTPPQDLVPPAIVSPDGAIVANDQFQNEKKNCEDDYNKHRVEFEILDFNKKAEYLSNERKNFYLSLKANSNNCIES